MMTVVRNATVVWYDRRRRFGNLIFGDSGEQAFFHEDGLIFDHVFGEEVDNFGDREHANTLTDEFETIKSIVLSGRPVDVQAFVSVSSDATVASSLDPLLLPVLEQEKEEKDLVGNDIKTTKQITSRIVQIRCMVDEDSFGTNTSVSTTSSTNKYVKAKMSALDLTVTRVLSLKQKLLKGLEDGDANVLKEASGSLFDLVDRCPLDLRRKVLRSSVWDLLTTIHNTIHLPRSQPFDPTVVAIASEIYDRFSGGGGDDDRRGGGAKSSVVTMYGFSPRQKRILKQMQEFVGSGNDDKEDNTAAKLGKEIRARRSQQQDRPKGLSEKAEVRLKMARKVLQSRVGSVILVMENVEDPDNKFGMYRTCEALGIQEIWIVQPPRPDVLSTRRALNRVSRRAQRWLTIKTFNTTQELIQAAKQKGINLWVSKLGDSNPHHANTTTATAASSSSSLSRSSAATTSTPLDSHIVLHELKEKLLAGDRVAVVVGNEHIGVSEQMVECADKLVHLPMFGFVESLNVGIAAALMMQHLADASREVGVGIGGPAGLREDDAKETWQKWKTSITEPWRERADREGISCETNDNR
eukprot:jgi/Bigna1/138236/aug1.43_g12944